MADQNQYRCCVCDTIVFLHHIAQHQCEEKDVLRYQQRLGKFDNSKDHDDRSFTQKLVDADFMNPDNFMSY